MSTPLDVLGQSFSQSLNVLVSGIRSIDSFQRSAMNSVNSALPSPNQAAQALNSIVALPQSIVPKGGQLALPKLNLQGLPQLGQAGGGKGLSLPLPTMKEFGQIFPSSPPPILGGSKDDPQIFGGAEQKTHLKTSDNNKNGATLF